MLDDDQRPVAGEHSPAPETPQVDRARDEQGRFTPERESDEGETRPAGEEGAEATRAAEPAAEPEAETGDDARGKPPAWVQRRIDELTRARHEEARRRQALQAELDQLRAGARPEPEQAATEEAVRRERPELDPAQVRAAAMELRAQERFDESCNAAFDQGKAAFPDFEKTVAEFRHLGGLPRDFLDDVLEAGNAHATLHHLGKNLDEADRIMALPPRGRAIALARLSDKLAAPPAPRPLSRAPAPIEPVSGSGRPSALNTDPDALSTEEWMRRRNAGEIR